MPVRRRPLILQAPVTHSEKRAKKKDPIKFVLFVNVVALRFYFFCSCDLNEERAEWEERRGQAAPRQRQRKDRVDVHIC